MKVSIIGAGKVGLPLGVAVAGAGHFVCFTDRDFKKLKESLRGNIPFYEPGLKKALQKNPSRLKWTKDLREVTDSKFIFLTLSLPVKANGDFDLSGVMDWTKKIIQSAKKEKILILKSTLPVGTNTAIRSLIEKSRAPVHVVTCPEFLRQGHALKDISAPDRIVIGGPSPSINKKVAEFYKTFSRGPVIFTSPETAEISKLTANSFLALKISFINLTANLAERFSADMNDLRRVLGADPRIGDRFLQWGLGWGGSCFPKDLKHLVFQGERAGISMNLLKEAEKINRQRVDYFFQRIKKIDPKLKDATYALWGISFKEGTDDMSHSPALSLARKLIQAGARLSVFDPLLSTDQDINSIFKLPAKSPATAGIVFCESPLSALKSARGLIVGTGWRGFQNIPLKDIKKHLKIPLIIDGRGVFHSKDLKRAGFIPFPSGSDSSACSDNQSDLSP